MNDTKTFVHMRHPSLPDDQKPASVTKAAFDDIWSEKGWVLISAAEAAEAEAEQDLDDLNPDVVPGSLEDPDFDVDTALKAPLVTRAEAMGLESGGTAEDIRTRIKEATRG